jgi:hypothetical protein
VNKKAAIRRGMGCTEHRINPGEESSRCKPLPSVTGITTKSPVPYNIGGTCQEVFIAVQGGRERKKNNSRNMARKCPADLQLIQTKVKLSAVSLRWGMVVNEKNNDTNACRPTAKFSKEFFLVMIELMI